MRQYRIFRKDRLERHRLVFEGKVTLAPAKEWHSKPLWFRRGDRVTFTARSERKVFAGLHAQRKYSDQGQVEGAYTILSRTGAAPFVEKKVRENGDYYVVLRKGRFGESSEVEVRVTVDEPILAGGAAWNESPSKWDTPIDFASAGEMRNPPGWTGGPWTRNNTLWVVVGVIAFFLVVGNLLVLFGRGGQALLLAIEADGSMGAVIVALLLFLSKNPADEK